MVASALRPGDYVVHLEHGVGIYRGIETIFVGQGTVEVAVLEYEGGDRLNVPLYRLDQLERYRAAGDDGERPPPKLHRLGGTSWQRVREKTREAIKALAAELLDLYARRPQVQERMTSQIAMTGTTSSLASSLSARDNTATTCWRDTTYKPELMSWR